jgi:hypothetical protein
MLLGSFFRVHRVQQSVHQQFHPTAHQCIELSRMLDKKEAVVFAAASKDSESKKRELDQAFMTRIRLTKFLASLLPVGEQP